MISNKAESKIRNARHGYVHPQIDVCTLFRYQLQTGKPSPFRVEDRRVPTKWMVNAASVESYQYYQRTLRGTTEGVIPEGKGGGRDGREGGM